MSASEKPAIDMRSFVEERFGSDEALGIMFIREDGKGSLTPKEADDVFRELGNKAPATYAEFPDGSSAITCTNYAVQVGYLLPDRTEIHGFNNKNNPESRVAIEEIHPGGHDFAIVDDRWLVDPWIRLVAGNMDQICYDMNDPEEARVVKEIYGDRSNWERLKDTEEAYKNTAIRTDISFPPIEPTPALKPAPKPAVADEVPKPSPSSPSP